MGIKIEVGKTYKNDSGWKAEIVQKLDDKISMLRYRIPNVYIGIRKFKGSPYSEIYLKEDGFVPGANVYLTEEVIKTPKMLAYISLYQVGSIGKGNLRYFLETDQPTTNHWMRAVWLDSPEE